MLGNLVKYKSIVYNYRRPLRELMAPYFVIHQKSEDTHLQLYSRNVQKLFLKWSRETERGLIAISKNLKLILITSQVNMIILTI